MHAHFENDKFRIFELPLRQPRPQSPRSIYWPTGERGQIRLSVEKQFHFLVRGTAFFFISLTSQERSPKQCGRARLWRKKVCVACNVA